MFADINAGGGVSSHRDSALKASENFEVGGVELASELIKTLE